MSIGHNTATARLAFDTAKKLGAQAAAEIKNDLDERLTKGDARENASRSVARVKSIKFSAQRRPSEGTACSLRDLGPSCLGVSDDPWLDEDQLAAGLRWTWIAQVVSKTYM